jgi:hypothetical protein
VVGDSFRGVEGVVRTVDEVPLETIQVIIFPCVIATSSSEQIFTD